MSPRLSTAIHASTAQQVQQPRIGAPSQLKDPAHISAKGRRRVEVQVTFLSIAQSYSQLDAPSQLLCVTCSVLHATG